MGLLRVRIVIDEPLDEKDLVFITGFHGIGFVGYIATRYIAQSLKARRIGYVDVVAEPPSASLYQGSLVIPYEIYRSGRVIMFLANYGVDPKRELEITRKVARWVAMNNFSVAFLVGGLDIRTRVKEEEKMRLVPTRAFKEVYRHWMKYPELEEGLQVFGPLAVFLIEFEKFNFPAVTVLPYANVARPDPGAAAEAVRYISEVLDLKIDVKKLLETASKIEQEIEELRRKLEKKEETKMAYI